jgi:hypothetical protein
MSDGSGGSELVGVRGPVGDGEEGPEGYWESGVKRFGLEKVGWACCRTRPVL